MSHDRSISSLECGIVCVGVKDVRSKLISIKAHEQRQLSRDLSYGILKAVLAVEGRCLWVDSGELGLELILYERAVDAIKAAEQITHAATIKTSDWDLELQVAVHWGEVALDNRSLKVFGESIQDVKALERDTTTGTPNVSTQCIEAAKLQRTCDELCERSWIFISYSHADNKRPNFLEELLQQIRPYEATGELGIFVDTRIRPGDQWFRTIMASLANHRLAVLLVGPGFFASDFIMSQELPYIEEAYTQRNLKLLWVYLIETAYLNSSWINTVQAAHHPLKPVRRSGRLGRNEIWTQVVNKITEITKSPAH